MEDALDDSLTLRAMIRIEPSEAPDEKTICKFRLFLEWHHRTEDILVVSRRFLGRHGLMAKEGAVVDVTTIVAPASTRN